MGIMKWDTAKQEWGNMKAANVTLETGHAKQEMGNGMVTCLARSAIEAMHDIRHCLELSGNA